MAITMKNYAVTWTDPDGTRRASVVSYDLPSAEHRTGELETAGCTEVAVGERKPGKRPAVRS